MPPPPHEIQAFAAPNGAWLPNAFFAELPNAPQRPTRRLSGAVAATRSVLFGETAGERMELDGPGYLQYETAGNSYQVGHMSFFQVNRFLVEPMVETVTAGRAGGLALDLYAGVGLFSVPLARGFERVVAVEADPAAARDLEANLKAGGNAAQAVNAETETFLANWKEKPDLVVLDIKMPGLDGLAAGIVAIAAAAFAILSASFGRADAAVLSAIVCGSTLAFLYHNYHPAKIFMGDSGALALGFLPATLSLAGLPKTAAAITLVGG